MHDFKQLRVWQIASELAAEVHAAVRRFPPGDRGVTALQLRRAAESVPANIAEGCGIATRREAVRYLKQASRSAAEVENHLLMAQRLGFIHPRRAQSFLARTTSIQRMLAGLIGRLPPPPQDDAL